MRVLDLFSGIGGFSLGLERAGMETVAFCEIDPFCQKVLRKHWPDVPVYDDVRTIDYDGPVDVICGGFPCQPFSAAGKRRGTKDDRYLWPEMLRVAEKYKPTWFIGENVAGLTSMGVTDSVTKMEGRLIISDERINIYEGVYLRKEIMLLNRICEELEQIGFEVTPLIVPACAVDAPHRRDRVWIIANNDVCGQQRACAGAEEHDAPLCGETTANPDSKRGNGGATQYGKNGRQEFEGISDVANAVSERRCGGNAEREDAENARQSPRGQITGFWDFEPAVGRVANGIPRRVDQLRALGNAVVPQIPEIIGKAIMEMENESD